MYLFAFDLDGTLIDSRAAVRAAYATAGATMPDDAWGKPFAAWCTDPAVHKRKEELYPHALAKYGRPGPALPLFDAMLHKSVGLIIVTGASEAGARASMKFLGIHSPLWHDQSTWSGLYTSRTAADKRELFEAAGKNFRHCFFVDADEGERKLIEGLNNWSFIKP